MEIATFMIDWMKDVTKQLTRIADANEASAKRLEVLDPIADLKAESDSLRRSLENVHNNFVLAKEHGELKDKEYNNLKDYVKTINLNVPPRYRCAQLDLSMVRMRTALAQVGQVLDRMSTKDRGNEGFFETIESIQKELREALIPK